MHISLGRAGGAVVARDGQEDVLEARDRVKELNCSGVEVRLARDHAIEGGVEIGALLRWPCKPFTEESIVQDDTEVGEAERLHHAY